MQSPAHDASSGIYPRVFRGQEAQDPADPYLRDDATRRLLSFFERKGLAALKAEDRHETWAADWIDFQAKHGLYAAVLSPAGYSTRGGRFDLLRYARFLEVFAYCSPGHGYSLQVTFLGLFAILMGTNEPLKREAVARLEAGELFALGVSERDHGSDLLANEFQFSFLPASPADKPGERRLAAYGAKYYIGNSNVASIIATLGKMADGDGPVPPAGSNRLPFALAALRPARGTPAWADEKIHTHGVRAAHVGSFDVFGQVLAEGDLIATGRAAWDAVFGTVTLGKFFLGFGSIGICEHALAETATHLRDRTLYGKPAMEMAHLQALMAEAYARILAMKLFAYRALDYVHAASPDDRRYQLYCAVQKAKVSTEGVKVMALISECLGARGFEGDTFCEMALRDAALIPGLEGSIHINLALAAQFAPRYFEHGATVPEVGSLIGGEVASRENAYLLAARTGSIRSIHFDWTLRPYRPFRGQSNAVLFARQAAAFRQYFRAPGPCVNRADLRASIAFGKCMTTLVYGQLVAENAAVLKIPSELVDYLFALLVKDMSLAATELAATRNIEERWIRQLIRLARMSDMGQAEAAQRIEECEDMRHG